MNPHNNFVNTRYCDLDYLGDHLCVDISSFTCKGDIIFYLIWQIAFSLLTFQLFQNQIHEIFLRFAYFTPLV